MLWYITGKATPKVLFSFISTYVRRAL